MKTIRPILIALALVLAMAGPARAYVTTSPGVAGAFPSAVPTGTNDATIALQALLNQGGRITFPPGKFTTGALYPTNNTTITGPGAVLTLKAGATNCAVFNVLLGITNVVISDIAFDGLDYTAVSSWASRDSLSNRMGLSLDINAKGSRIENVTAFGFNKGISITGNQDGLNVFRLGDLVVSGCECYSNFWGLYAASSTSDALHAVEYFTPTQMRLHDNTVGFNVGGGNIGVIGCDINENFWGVLVDGAAQNAAHGIISGNHINHNNSAILVANFTAGSGLLIGPGNQIRAVASGISILVSNSANTIVEGNQFDSGQVIIGWSGVAGSSKGPNFVFDNSFAGIWGTGMRVFDWNNFANLITDNTTNAQHWGNYSFTVSTNADPYQVNPYTAGALTLSPTNLPPAVPFTPNASFYWNSNGTHIFIVRSTGLAWSSTNLLN